MNLGSTQMTFKSHHHDLKFLDDEASQPTRPNFFDVIAKVLADRASKLQEMKGLQVA